MGPDGTDRQLNILAGLAFYPRGGSAQVVRYLSRALIERGHRVHLVTGSLSDGDPQHDARTFYQDIPLTTVDYTEAWEGFKRGENPIAEAWEVPFHPSYEDKPGVPDRAFYQVTKAEYDTLIRCWTEVFKRVSGRFEPDVLHLHHLLHVHLAASEVFPKVPKAAHLHGTEIKMLENLDVLGRESGVRGELHDVAGDAVAGAARKMQHFFAISPDVRERGVARLSIDRSAITTIPNGVDVSVFRPADWSDDERLTFLRKILVQEPQGWDETGVPGTIRYTETDLERFQTREGALKPLALFVGRFLDFKRVPMLLRAVSQVNQGLAGSGDGLPYNLLVWGGMPGEWEGEHPHTLAQTLELPNVFFCGWLPHSILSEGLNLADVFVAPSYYEPFGQVFLEAMATGVPVIATRSGGPLDFVVDSGDLANGWLSEVDDVADLARVLGDALVDEGERQRRGENALALVRECYDWRQIAGEYVRSYRRLVESAS
jgi:glycosyltransferase involved in cell wall biosynthesis